MSDVTHVSSGQKLMEVIASFHVHQITTKFTLIAVRGTTFGRESYWT